MSVREHYKNHLATFYSWMTGDFKSKQQEFQDFLKEHSILPNQSGMAIDLGAGHGIQSIALSKSGFQVTAIDFNEQLLDELKSNDTEHTIDTINADIMEVRAYSHLKPELIVCCGDTISHLDLISTIDEFIATCKATLIKNGRLILSFRDYANELTDEERFIPVKNDENKILTCILEYQTDKIRVTDLLHEKTEQGWNQKVSSYQKVRVTTKKIEELLEKNGLSITYSQSINRMQTIIAEK